MSNNTNTNKNNTQNIKEENTMNTYALTEIKDRLNTTARFIGNVLDIDNACMQKHIQTAEEVGYSYRMTITALDGHKTTVHMYVGGPQMEALIDLIVCSFHLDNEAYKKSIETAEPGLLSYLTETPVDTIEAASLNKLFRTALSSNILRIEIATGDVCLVFPDNYLTFYNTAILQFVTDIADENGYALDFVHKTVEG